MAHHGKKFYAETYFLQKAIKKLSQSHILKCR